jgi:ribonuclease HII
MESVEPIRIRVKRIIKPKPKEESPVIIETPVTKKRVRRELPVLNRYYNELNQFEIGIDEAGRGPLYGRVYVGAVILPKDHPDFHYEWLRDSKTIKSHKKIVEISEHIKSYAVAYSIQYAEAGEIDRINILQAVMMTMHKCLDDICGQIGIKSDNDYQSTLALVDGNYFKPYIKFDETTDTILTMPHVTVEQGDGHYMSIAAASILAKCARDEYMLEECEKNPEWKDNYGFHTNMGYGTKKHMEGIQEHGMLPEHRRSFLKKFL